MFPLGRSPRYYASFKELEFPDKAMLYTRLSEIEGVFPHLSDNRVKFGFS
jgi:hypothetical protein